MKTNNHGHIEITSHAMSRLIERVKEPGKYGTWNRLVKYARYYGADNRNMTNEQYSYVFSHFDKSKFTNSMAIRYLDGFFYVFRGNSGHARTLVTVIEYEET